MYTRVHEYMHKAFSFFEGTQTYDTLQSILTNSNILKDIKKLSSDAQKSCIEGFHSLLNHWHPKMTHFSWLGTKCRLEK